jgi:apolipoprotein N-acyltransferase
MNVFVRPRSGNGRWADALGAVAITMLIAAPWLWQELVPCEWLGVAAALACLPHLRGWRGETLVLAVAAASLATAFHWSPTVLADAIQSSYGIGLAFTVPIVLWDALRLSLPFWFVSRTVVDPRNAWLPAALVAVATEAFVIGIFPWKLGYSQLAWPVLVQSVDLLGPEAATFVLYAHAGVIVLVVEMLRRRWRPAHEAVGPAWRRSWSARPTSPTAPGRCDSGRRRWPRRRRSAWRSCRSTPAATIRSTPCNGSHGRRARIATGPST